jgi:asparagine N-glycosylation enzyme membrane subunit Stt3
MKKVEFIFQVVALTAISILSLLTMRLGINVLGFHIGVVLAILSIASCLFKIDESRSFLIYWKSIFHRSVTFVLGVLLLIGGTQFQGIL